MSRYDIMPWWSDTSTDLRALVLVSLFSDRRAEDDDQIPDPTGDPPYRRGWWGDSMRTDGDLFGSRLWLLHGQALSDELADSCADYCREALQWMIDDGLVAEIAIETEIYRDFDRLAVRIELLKPDDTVIAVEYHDLWAALGEVA
jgi:phage gp46-like protein